LFEKITFLIPGFLLLINWLKQNSQSVFRVFLDLAETRKTTLIAPILRVNVYKKNGGYVSFSSRGISYESIIEVTV